MGYYQPLIAFKKVKDLNPECDSIYTTTRWWNKSKNRDALKQNKKKIGSLGLMWKRSPVVLTA